MGITRAHASRRALFALLSACDVLAAGCGSSGSAPGSGYTVGGTVAGLADGSQLVLVDNGEDSTVVSQSGLFSFGNAVPGDTRYQVTVGQAPAGEVCSVAGGDGMVRSANVANIVVTCSDRAFTLGGSIRGLSTGGLVLKNGADTLSVDAGASTFTLRQTVPYGSAYGVLVQSQPEGATCTVQAGSGTMPADNVANVLVNCTAQPSALGGTVSGLGAGSGLVLANGAVLLVIPPMATGFQFPVPLNAGTPYQVTVNNVPPGMQCVVSGGSGVMPGTAVTSVAVACGPTTYSLGGTVSGLFAHGLVLANGADTLSVPFRAGVFSMPTQLPAGARYAIVVQTQPAGLSCAVANGSGTMGAAAVTSVVVTCASGAFTIGGSVSGLLTSGLVLTDGTDSLAVFANAQSFTMPTGLPSGAYYEVTVAAHPPTVSCAASSASGTVGSADVTGIVITCAPGAESPVYAFSGLTDGSTPYGSLLLGSDGNLYGLTYIGGLYGGGEAFRIAPDGSESVLYSFGAGADGSNPHGSLTQGSDGNLYGVTAYGGAYGHGVAFALSASGIESVLYSFGAGADAQDPYGSLLLASDGNFYGMSVHGGTYGAGTVFMVSPQGSELVLHSFGAAGDGQAPFGSLIQAADGNLYGMTGAGGLYSSGSAFRMTLQGAETLLHSFGSGSDGANPAGSLVQGSDGNFYGLTRDGGAYGTGAVIELSSAGSESVLVSLGAGTDGANPFGDVLLGSDGSFYALARNGGANGAGAVLQISSGGSESVVYSFAGAQDGAAPYGSLIETADGSLYGMTSAGGSGGTGTVFRVN
jgi:uncharacterized repeat protein (TIGR03803 family)